MYFWISECRVCYGSISSCSSTTLICPIKCFAPTSDNLSRAIDQTIERIEKSHLRGEDCAIAADIDKSTFSSRSAADGVVKTKENSGVVRIPRVFPMSNEVTCVGFKRDQRPKGKSRHFHPASDDPRQYTLLKFYELNAGAVKLLLDGRENDLPFVPGPKEHEIIHYRSDPQRSILLSGRSGTGKTTCLVFRIWAQHTAYTNGLNGSRPRQLFLTKNDMLCREVKRSFNNMGLAWQSGMIQITSVLHKPRLKGQHFSPQVSGSTHWMPRCQVRLLQSTNSSNDSMAESIKIVV